MTNYYSNIVIAEDHHFLRRGIVNFLNAQPALCVVGEAENGLELIEHVHIYSPDIAITDVRMEKMNGMQATKKLAKPHPGLHVIAMSFSTKPAYIDEIISAGAVVLLRVLYSHTLRYYGINQNKL
jgi:two-component system NarL family response regulator